MWCSRLEATLFVYFVFEITSSLSPFKAYKPVRVRQIWLCGHVLSPGSDIMSNIAAAAPNWQSISWSHTSPSLVKMTLNPFQRSSCSLPIWLGHLFPCERTTPVHIGYRGPIKPMGKDHQQITEVIKLDCLQPLSAPQYPVNECYKQMRVESTSSTPSSNKVDAMLPKKARCNYTIAAEQ